MEAWRFPVHRHHPPPAPESSPMFKRMRFEDAPPEEFRPVGPIYGMPPHESSGFTVPPHHYDYSRGGSFQGGSGPWQDRRDVGYNPHSFGNGINGRYEFAHERRDFGHGVGMLHQNGFAHERIGRETADFGNQMFEGPGRTGFGSEFGHPSSGSIERSDFAPHNAAYSGNAVPDWNGFSANQYNEHPSHKVNQFDGKFQNPHGLNGSLQPTYDPSNNCMLKGPGKNQYADEPLLYPPGGYSHQPTHHSEAHNYQMPVHQEEQFGTRHYEPSHLHPEIRPGYGSATPYDLMIASNRISCDHPSTDGHPIQNNKLHNYSCPSRTPPQPYGSLQPIPGATSTMGWNSSPAPIGALFPVLPSTVPASVPPPSQTMSEFKHTSQQYIRGQQSYQLQHFHDSKATPVNASELFKQPYRSSRPDQIVIILRGLPGSGKSYLAKALRDLEVENGGNAPRIHAMDDYFMIEVEKQLEASEGSKSSGSYKGKKPVTKKAIEYCYEPEMEEVYRSSMLKAFKKTLDDGDFSIVIVDDRNLRVADFAQFWAIAKRSGYAVYLLEAPYKDPTGCAARNVHGFTLEDIKRMSEQWEEAPPQYLKLDIQSLFRGDELKEHSIREVDMDIEESDGNANSEFSHDENCTNAVSKSPERHPNQGCEKLNLDEEEELINVKELGKSKWLEDINDEREKAECTTGNSGALTRLVQPRVGTGKSVRWGDRDEKVGFSIAAMKRRNASSLIIGPGSGYNLVSNPLGEGSGSRMVKEGIHSDKKRQFNEQQRAERESFKAAFDRRRQRIEGLDDAEDE